VFKFFYVLPDGATTEYEISNREFSDFLQCSYNHLTTFAASYAYIDIFEPFSWTSGYYYHHHYHCNDNTAQLSSAL